MPVALPPERVKLKADEAFQSFTPGRASIAFRDGLE